MSSGDISSVAVPDKADKTEAEQPSAIRDGLQELGAGLFDLVAFWETFKALWKKPELAVHDPENRLKIAPLPFAAQAAVLLYLITGSAGWFADTFWDIPNWDKVGYQRDVQRLDAALAAAKNEKEKAAAQHQKREYELSVKAGAIALNAAKAATAAAYLAGAWVFARVLRRWAAKYPQAAVADRAFLYEVTARNFVPAVVMFTAISLYLMFDRMLPETSGSPLKKLLTGVSLGVYSLAALWGTIMYVVSCRNLIRMFEMPRYTMRKREGDNKAHHAVAWAFVLASVLAATIPAVAQMTVNALYLMVRHATL